jgi:hypothetical protein
MAFRKKIYYPENQIERNLFTKGKEWMTLDDWKEYNGFYHQYATGEVFTEKDWDPIRSKALVRYRDKQESYFKYLDLKHYTVVGGEKKLIIGGGGNQFYRYVAPRAVKRLPTEVEKQDGVMTRYFVYKRNEPNRVFFEVDKDQTDDYERDHTGINQYLYGLVEVPWKIDGPEKDVYKNGLVITPGVIDTNLRIVDRFSEKFPILRKLLNNPREFTKYDK